MALPALAGIVCLLLPKALDKLRVLIAVLAAAATVYIVQDAAGVPTRETVAGAFCTKCMHAVCVPCYDHDRGRCAVWEKRLGIIDREHAQRARFLGTVGSIYDLT